MDASPSGCPGTSLRLAIARERPPDVTTDDDSYDIPASGDDNDGYTLVMSRRTKRRMWKTLASGGSSSSTIITTKTYSLTVVYRPVVPAQNLVKISKRGLSGLLENTAPGQIKGARLNSLRNVIAVDAVNYSAVEAPLKLTVICGAPVRPYVPRGTNTAVGVISGVDGDMSDDDLMMEISAPKKVLHAHRFACPAA